MLHAAGNANPTWRSRHLAHGNALVVLVIALVVFVTLVVAVLRSEAFALRMIARAAGESAMALARGPDRCCDTSFSRVKLDFRPLRIEISDFELTRHDPTGERGGSALLADISLLTLRLDAGDLWSNRAALDSITIGAGTARLEAQQSEGPERWKIEVEDVSLNLFSRVFAGERDLAGIASGEVEIAGSLFAPDTVEVGLAVKDASIRIKRFHIQGRVSLEGDLARGPRGLEGEFEIDVSAAQVDVQGAYSKPAGTSGTISGKLVADESGQIEARDINYQAEKARVRIEL